MKKKKIRPMSDYNVPLINQPKPVNMLKCQFCKAREFHFCKSQELGFYIQCVKCEAKSKIDLSYEFVFSPVEEKKQEKVLNG